MATYVISDIHGEYDMLMDLLEKMSLQDEDILYVLGDVLDRGPHPIKTLRQLMAMPNVICLVGNHELMALESLKFLMQEASIFLYCGENNGKIKNCHSTGARVAPLSLAVLVFF